MSALTETEAYPEPDRQWYYKQPSEKELEVLQLYANGIRRADIANYMGIAENTVKVHIRHAKEKLGVKSTTQAVAVSIRNSFIE